MHYLWSDSHTDKRNYLVDAPFQNKLFKNNYIFLYMRHIARLLLIDLYSDLVRKKIHKVYKNLSQWNFVMHPVDAAFTCDPKGDFIRKWIPELSSLPDK